MVDIRRVNGGDWETIRRIRLRALQDTPEWFWATYEGERDRPEAWWRDFIDRGAWFVAEADDAVGIAAAVSHPERHDSVPILISMWVAPEARGRGVGRSLVDAVVAWARSQGIAELRLEVTSNNPTARRLYERVGFEVTGRTEPHPRAPELTEVEMRLRL